MAYRIDYRLFVVPFFLLATFGIAIVPAKAAVKKADCAAIATWAQTIDGKDRWTPVEGGRAWLPRAFAGDDFVKVFGAAPLDWTIEETKAQAAHINDCRQTIKDPGATRALNGARGYFIKLQGILVNVERQAAKATRQEQRQQAAAERDTARQQAAAKKEVARQQAIASRDETKLAEAVDQLLAEPDSPELLRALALVRTADVTNRETYTKAFQSVGIKAGRGLLQHLYGRKSNLTEPDLLAKIEAREKPLREKFVADKLAEIATLDPTMNSLNFLSQTGQSLRDLGPALTDADRETIGVAIRDKRIDIFEKIVVRAKQLIDQSPDNAEGLQRVGKIVQNSRKAIPVPSYMAEIIGHAKKRQQAISDVALAAATKKLDTFPATAEGLESLQQFAAQQARTFAPHATPEVRKQYGTDALGRINDVARAALPEFKKELAALPDNREGLEAAEKHLAKAKSMQDFEPDVTAAYLDAATQRRNAIDKAVTLALEERRQKAIAAGADPDLAGYSFVDSRSGMKLEFRDEERVFFSALGMKFAGKYEVSEDDVIVEGPNGNMVLTKGDKVLTGMGMTLKRQR